MTHPIGGNHISKEVVFMHSNKIYFAFPGMGKTTFALNHCGFIDLDFGNLRSAFKVEKSKEHELFNGFSRLIKIYYRDSYNVMTNEPSLIPLVKQFAEKAMVMELPLDNTELVSRVKFREEKRHVNADFPKQLAENVDTWVNDWERIAKRYSVPIIRVKYFKEV